MKQGLLKEAAREFESALQQDPKDAGALLGLARLRLAQQDDEAARGVLRRLIDLHPTHPEALSHMARLEAQDGNARALELLASLASQPKAGFFEVLNHGRALLTAGQHEAATAELERALHLQPGNPQVLTYLGMTLQAQKRLDQALKRYQEAAKATRTEHLPLLMASRVQVLQGQIGAALVSLQQAILRSPEEPILYREFALLSLAAGAPDAAMRAAIELRLKLPKSVDAVYLHGLAMLVAGKNEDAERILREALERLPGSADVRLALAKVRRRQGDDAEAQRLLEEAVKLAPDEPGPANDLAVLLMSRPGGAAAARAVLERALAVHPEDPGVNLNLALALADTEAKRARTHAERAQASTDPKIREQADRLVAALGSKAK
ncbi:tetratricopeptide repeat protein [Hyalangium sp.]|uniref:tetratricopeptide repeat protein n=1 Tax=Hyalangium sp. TaxID=2028555 RepID=UPI002D326132|nr:tetratricopeptide repeat protein [Hyalangium sp.]HYI03013.1 tetratricopeptide repeat protein [Hyalangium sp.]